MFKKIKKLLHFIKDVFISWQKDNPALLAAGISFFVLFSIVPLIILISGVLGNFVSERSAQQEIIRQVNRQFSPEIGKTLSDLIRSSRENGVGLASLFSGVLLLFLSSRVFYSLQQAMNVVWNAHPPKTSHPIKVFFKTQFLSFLMVAITGLLVFTYFLVDASLQTASSALYDYLPEVKGLQSYKVVSTLSSLIVFSFLFTFIFKYLPNRKIPWKEVFIGGTTTAILFTFGRIGISYYFRFSDLASFYGAIGSVAILLMWIYFSSLIFLFGAEFTRVYAEQFGFLGHRKHHPPKDHPSP